MGMSVGGGVHFQKVQYLIVFNLKKVRGTFSYLPPKHLKSDSSLDGHIPDF